MPFVATDTPRPASEGEESDTAARSKRRRKQYARSPRCDQTLKRRGSPPDQSCKYSRWGKPEFCRLVPPVLLAEVPASTHLSLLPRQNSGEPGKGCSITGRAAKRRRPPQAVHTISAGTTRVAARATNPRRTTCRLHYSGNRIHPVMKVPCQNRPHLLPTGRWSGGRTGRRAMR